jgi:DNA polymerase-3 subunit delta
MSVLANEVEKLCALAKARNLSAITEREVNEAAASTLECDTFAFSNAILEKNKKAAFIALDEMKSRRTDPVMILGMMAKTYTDILNVAMMLKDGVGQTDIQNATKMNPYKLKLYISAAKKYTTEHARKILAELTRVDTGAKYGGVTGYTAIELFISKCL